MNARFSETNARIDTVAGAIQSLQREIGTLRVAVTPGRDHWRIFRRLCDEAGAKGNLVPDAFLAAMAIEHGCEWITTDGDFARFPGLKWRHPLKVVRS